MASKDGVHAAHEGVSAEELAELGANKRDLRAIVRGIEGRRERRRGANAASGRGGRPGPAEPATRRGGFRPHLLRVLMIALVLMVELDDQASEKEEPGAWAVLFTKLQDQRKLRDKGLGRRMASRRRVGGKLKEDLSNSTDLA